MVAVLTGFAYFIYGVLSGHFSKNLVPSRRKSWRACWVVIAKHLHRKPPASARSYNVLQRIAYMSVIFVLFP